MKHIKVEIKGNIHKYAKLTAEIGYCFYDCYDEEKNYITEISTPITDENELAWRYIVVKGDADKLNKEKEKENG